MAEGNLETGEANAKAFCFPAPSTVWSTYTGLMTSKLLVLLLAVCFNRLEGSNIDPRKAYRCRVARSAAGPRCPAYGRTPGATRVAPTPPVRGRYSFQLAASNALGTGRWSPCSAPLPTGSAPPEAPQNLVATVSQDGEQQVVAKPTRLKERRRARTACI